MVAALIRKFSAIEHVPVDVNDVIAELRLRGVHDEIYFWPADLKSEKLRGQLVHTEPWDYPANDLVPVVYCADVYYAREMSLDWQRLVTCKEVLHILDPVGSRTSAEDEVTKLFEKIALPKDMQDPLKDGVAVSTDRLAIFQAVAVLFPKAVRDLLKAPLRDGKITLQDIKRMVDLPARYVNFVMHDAWDDAYRVLTE